MPTFEATINYNAVVEEFKENIIVCNHENETDKYYGFDLEDVRYNSLDIHYWGGRYSLNYDRPNDTFMQMQIHFCETCGNIDINTIYIPYLCDFSKCKC